MRILSIILLLSSLLFSASVDSEIRTNNKKLKQTEKSIKKSKKRIKSIESQISKETKELNRYDNLIKELNRDLKKYETQYSDIKDEFDRVSKAQRTLLQTKDRLEKRLIELFSQHFSLSIVRNSIDLYSLEDIILSEIYTDVINISQKEIKQLNADYLFVKSDLDKYKARMKKIKKFIIEREKKRAKIKTAQDKQKSILTSLEKKHLKYQKKLKKSVKDRKEIAKILDNLKIVKKEKIVKVKEKKEAKIVKVKKEKNIKSNEKFANVDIRTIGSSYKKVKTRRYKGLKTIAPLKSFSIEKKFGTNYDPIYKIKLFNESLILKPAGYNKDVVSVLDGKVIYAQNNPSLGNVIIIEHRSGYHTVYAHLSEISPRIKIGKRVKQNYNIGKVNKTLSFQVTKSGSYIDPMEFIKIN